MSTISIGILFEVVFATSMILIAFLIVVRVVRYQIKEIGERGVDEAYAERVITNRTRAFIIHLNRFGGADWYWDKKLNFSVYLTVVAVFTHFFFLICVQSVVGWNDSDPDLELASRIVIDTFLKGGFLDLFDSFGVNFVDQSGGFYSSLVYQAHSFVFRTLYALCTGFILLSFIRKRRHKRAKPFVPERYSNEFATNSYRKQFKTEPKSPDWDEIAF